MRMTIASTGQNFLTAARQIQFLTKLTTLWQQHRKTLLIAAAGLLIMLLVSSFLYHGQEQNSYTATNSNVPALSAQSDIQPALSQTTQLNDNSEYNFFLKLPEKDSLETSLSQRLQDLQSNLHKNNLDIMAVIRDINAFHQNIQQQTNLNKAAHTILKISTLDLLSFAWQAAGQPLDALAATEAALEIVHQYWGPGHRQSGLRFEIMARLYDSIGQNQAALLFQERALKIAADNQDISPAILAMNYNNLGENYRLTGELSRSRNALEKGISILENYAGSTAPEMVVLLNNMGMTQADSGQLTQAESFLRQSLELSSHNNGIHHPASQRILQNLQQILSTQGRQDSALALRKRYL